MRTGVSKQRVTPGEGWETPKELCKCEVSYKVWSGTGVNMKTHTEETTCTLHIDEGQSPIGFLMTSSRRCVNQKSRTCS